MYQRYHLAFSHAQIAKHLGVDVSTVNRTPSLFDVTGDVISIQGYHSKTTKKMSDAQELEIIEAVIENPSVHLRELLYPTIVDTSTICRFLKQQGFTRKKMKFIAQQRNAAARDLFISELSIYKSHMLVFVDESGADKRSSLRKYG